MKPRTAAAMPEISSDFRTFTLRIRPGIFFQDDPAFKGKPRELVAQDYVYQLKRVFDPRWKSPLWPTIENVKVVGLAESAQAKRSQAEALTMTAKSKAARTIDRLHVSDPARGTRSAFL